METTEILKTLGIELAEGETLSADLLTTKLGEKYVDVSLHKKEVDAAFGKAMGTMETKLKPLLGEDAKGLKGEQMAEKLASKFADMAALVDAAKKDGASTAEIAKLQKKADDLAGLLEQANAAAEAYKTEAATAREKAFEELSKERLNAKITETYNRINWSEQANEYAKKGLYIEISAKYDFKEEAGKLMAYDKDGNIVKIGTSHATADQIFQQEAKAAKLWKEVNQAAGGQRVTIDPADKHAAKRAERLAFAEKLKPKA